MYAELDRPRNLGHFMLALDIARFTDNQAFADQIALFMQEIHDEGALAPGDPERLSTERRKRDGIELPETTAGELNALAGELGVPKP
jgi:LDH2 family malate/lactate/ureidoglycolate dehydrogenase